MEKAPIKFKGKSVSIFISICRYSGDKNQSHASIDDKTIGVKTIGVKTIGVKAIEVKTIDGKLIEVMQN